MAKPKPVIDRNILLTKIGVEKPEFGDAEIPLNMAKELLEFQKIGKVSHIICNLN